MSCERYKTVIVEAAAAGEIGPSLRVHLEGCAECRATFTEEQSLFSAIDAGLSQPMDVSPSPEFLPRIRSAIDLENSDWPAPTSNVWFRWLPIAGVAAVACLALAFAVRHHSLMPEQHQPVTSALAREPAEAALHAQQEQPKPEAAVRAMAGPIKLSAKHGLQPHADRIEPTPEILVPPEERVALAQFVAGLSQRREVALALARPAPFEPQPETPPGESLEIPKLEVPPLIPMKEK
jgi:hypothetical protein